MARRKLFTDRRTGDPGALKRARNSVFNAIAYGLDTFDPHIRELRNIDRFHRASERQARRHARQSSRRAQRRFKRTYGRNLRERFF